MNDYPLYVFWAMFVGLAVAIVVAESHFKRCLKRVEAKLARYQKVCREVETLSITHPAIEETIAHIIAVGEDQEQRAISSLDRGLIAVHNMHPDFQSEAVAHHWINHQLHHIARVMNEHGSSGVSRQYYYNLVHHPKSPLRVEWKGC